MILIYENLNLRQIRKISKEEEKYNYGFALKLLVVYPSRLLFISFVVQYHLFSSLSYKRLDMLYLWEISQHINDCI